MDATEEVRLNTLDEPGKSTVHAACHKCNLCIVCGDCEDRGCGNEVFLK